MKNIHPQKTDAINVTIPVNVQVIAMNVCARFILMPIKRIKDTAIIADVSQDIMYANTLLNTLRK